MEGIGYSIGWLSISEAMGILHYNLEIHNQLEFTDQISRDVGHQTTNQKKILIYG